MWEIEWVFGIEKQNYGYDRYRRRGLSKVSTESMLNFLGLNIAKLFRFYETRKTNTYWTVPTILETEKFKKPSIKRLIKKANKLNKTMVDNYQKSVEVFEQSKIVR